MKVEFDYHEIVDFLEDFLEIPTIVQKLEKLKNEFDWNPFDEDEDEYVGVFAEVNHNADLVWDLATAIVGTLEAVVIGGLSLTSQEKHKAAKEALDRAIRLPWYAEPFDGPMIDLTIGFVVRHLNSVGWTEPEGLADDIETAIVRYATRRGKPEVKS